MKLFQLNNVNVKDAEWEVAAYFTVTYEHLDGGLRKAT
jgi:hypothetical protein